MTILKDHYESGAVIDTDIAGYRAGRYGAA